MSEKSASARPSQVTMAGWVALVGSVLLVATLFEAVAQLHTVESRDAVEEFLSTPPGSGLGLDIAQALEVWRWLMLFSGAAAAAATVLAIFVLKRDNAARVVFTVAAVAIMLTTPPAGGFFAIMIAFAALLLWTRPARAWFAGVPASEAGSARAGKDPAALNRPRPPEGHVMSSENRPPQQEPEGEETRPWPTMPEEGSGRPQPPPTQGFGTPPGQQPDEPGRQTPPATGQPAPQAGEPPHQAGYPYPSQPYGEQLPYGQPPYGQSYGQQVPYGGYPQQYGQLPYGQLPPGQPAQSQAPYGQPYYGAGPVVADQRPPTVTAAAWITWVLSGLTLIGIILVGLVMVATPDEFVRQIEEDPGVQSYGVPTDQVVAALWVMLAVGFVWTVAAIVLAWFAYRRAGWARITLVVSAAVTALFSLVSSIAGSPALLFHTLAAGLVIVLLFIGGANDWYARRAPAQGFPGPYPPQGQQPQQYGGQPGQPPYGGYPGQQPPQQYGGQPGQAGQQYGGQPGQPPEPRREGGKDEPPPNVW